MLHLLREHRARALKSLNARATRKQLKMATEKSPAYQRYPNDYLTDPKVVAMTLEEEGAYNRLMDYCWKEGSLSTNLRDLAAMCKNITTKRMEKIWTRVGKCFVSHPTEPGRVIHKRLEEERQRQQTWRDRQSDHGRSGADKRWGRHGQPIQTPMGSDSISSASASSSSSSLVIDWAEVDSMDVENFVSRAIQAANGGMIAAGIEFNPILGNHTSRQDVFDWIEAGASRRTILEAVFDAAKGARKQISSMRYFTKAVTNAQEKGRAVVIPEGSQAHEVKQKGVGANYPQSQAKRAGNPQEEQDKLDRRRVEEWKTEHPEDAERIWNEIRDDMVAKGMDALGKEHFRKAVDAHFRKKIVGEFLTPKAVA